jgi:uncharacterized protein YxjI
MATSSSTNNQAVVNTIFCIQSTTTFAVWKKPAVPSIVGGRWTIQDSEGCEKFKLEESALKEPELALKESNGNPILTVKPKGKKQWNVFTTMESVLQPGKKKSKTPDLLFTVETSGDYSKIEVSLKDYTIEGSFAKRIFTISHISRGVAAKVELNNKVEDKKIDSVYNVEVQTGFDQAFIFGLVAVFEQIRKRLTKK